MQQQPVIHIIGVGEVGIRIINQLIRYEPHYITTGIAIATEADTLHDAQVIMNPVASRVLTTLRARNL
jgi:cell division GTPase FtsZ